MSMESNIKKDRTRVKTRYAVKTGKLIQKPCEVCGEIKVDNHHMDYSDYLNIKWLCRKHHIEWHRNNPPDSKLPLMVRTVVYLTRCQKAKLYTEAKKSKYCGTISDVMRHLIDKIK